MPLWDVPYTPWGAVSLFHAAFFLWVDCEASHRREIHDIVVYDQLLPYTILPPGEWRVAMSHATRSWTADTMFPPPLAPCGFVLLRFHGFSTHCTRVFHAG
jgi:hypothetical protein